MSQKPLKHTLFINRLTEIVDANLADANFGVSYLAEKYGISHSQLHRKLKAICNKSASQFIREIRLEKAKEMLEQELFTVSEIAFKVGFGSTTYFNKCFREYFGYTPSDFRGKIDEKEDNLETFTTGKHEKYLEENTKTITGKNGLTIVLGIIIVLLLSFSLYKYFYEDKNSTDDNVKSIAILRLRNLSDDLDSEHLAGGIMDDILNRLSQINGLVVKSQINSEKSWDSEMTLPEIAENLDVGFILEGSILKEDSRVRIYVHLIDARSNVSVWSTNYDNNSDDIFSFVSEASGQIANELQLAISTEAKKQITKTYTDNSEAYNLYLEGRFFWRYKEEQKIRKSISLFNQALEVDSSYSLAYAGLADAYNNLAFHRYEQREQAIEQSKEYAFKAIELDNTLAEAHTTLGCIYMLYDYNWELAEKELELAIKYNPSYILAYEWYSEYLNLLGKQEDSRKIINRAIELNPHSIAIRYKSYSYYLRQGDYSNAWKESNKIYNEDKNFRHSSDRRYNIFVRQQKFAEAANEYKKFVTLQSTISEAEIDSIYAESGMNGLIELTLDYELNQYWTTTTAVKYIIVAQNYALLHKTDSTLYYLEKAFENEEAAVRSIKFDSDYKHLRTEPRFLELLDNLNLGGY